MSNLQIVLACWALVLMEWVLSFTLLPTTTMLTFAVIHTIWMIVFSTFVAVKG